MTKPTTSEWAHVEKSSIHNNGMFATKDIPKGTKIIQYVGELISKKESDNRADRQLDAHKEDSDVGSVYIFTLNKTYDIDGYVDYNTAKWINHSCSPNSEVEIIDDEIWIMSKKNIKKDDEITYNYGYDVDDYENHPCRCNSPNCIGYIVAQHHWKKLKKKLKRKKSKEKRLAKKNKDLKN